MTQAPKEKDPTESGSVVIQSPGLGESAVWILFSVFSCFSAAVLFLMRVAYWQDLKQFLLLFCRNFLLLSGSFLVLLSFLYQDL